MNNKPKRRKSNDNPYTLEVINNTNIVIFKDGNNKIQLVEVSKEIYNQMNQFELDDISQMHKIERHIEHSELYENTLYKRAINKPNSTEEIVEKNIFNKNIRMAIKNLPTIQKKRIIKYYFEGMTLDEIANLEHTSHQAVSKSILNALDKIKKNLKI